MSQPVDSQGWGRFKNVIRGLYMIKGHKLEGPEGVIKIMETQHGFKKSKAQYEKQFKDWGFKKNRTKRDWEIMNRKIQHRKRIGKESDVYQDGRLMPAEKLQKETSRQGYMTTVEQFRNSLEAPPQTPPGFDIRTPLGQPLYRLAFENLPIFQFQGLARPIYGTIAPLGSSTSALTTIFKSPGRKTDNGIPPILHSLIPTSAFPEEPRAAGLAIQRAKDLGHAELFNLAIFLASNNFPGNTNSKNLRKWLRIHNATSFLEALLSTEGPTAETLVENLFRFAVEDGDVSTVKYLLWAGVNPNGRKCRYGNDGVTPLQFALIQKNIEMSLELINAGSTIDEPNTGWKSSALVLAIIANGADYNQSSCVDNYESDIYESEGYEDSDAEDSDAEDSDAEDNEADGRYCVDSHAAAQEAPDGLSGLVNSLVNAGAVINPSSHFFQTHSSEKSKHYTPLSAASSALRNDIVDLLIQHGADVTLEDDWAFSALHECLYRMDGLEGDLLNGWLRPLRYRHTTHRGPKRLGDVINVVCRLIKAGANVNEEIYCGSYFELPHEYPRPKSYTIFDLGVLTGSIEVVNLLISAGAQTTLLSVKYAVRFQSFVAINQLLLTGASVWTNIITDNQAHYIESYDIWIKEVAFFKAMHLGHVSTIECLFNDGTFKFDGVLNKAAELEEAIESCCFRGHIETLLLILQNVSRFQFSLSPWFGDSLCLAILTGHDDVIDTLLSAGADVNAIGPKGVTPLFAAIKSKNQNLSNRLRGMGAVSNSKSPCDSVCSAVHGISGDALITAILGDNAVAVNQLIENGADIEAFGTTSERKDDNHCTCIRPLTAALITKKMDLLHYLIRRGVKINNPLEGTFTRIEQATLISVRMTPLAAAVYSRDCEVVDFLIHRGANPYDGGAIRGTHNNPQSRKVLLNALQRSCKPSNIECAKDAILGAILRRDIEMVKTILYSPVWDIKVEVTLSFALEYAMTLYCSTIKAIENMHSLVKILLEADAETSTTILLDRCYSPVQSAVRTGHHEVAQTLLEYGSNPNSVSVNCPYADYDCRTPLQIAVEKQDLEMINILLRYKADANGTAIDEHDADNNEHKKRHFLHRTPLQEASMGGSKEIVELMLEHGADVNSPPVAGGGATALQYAALHGFLGIAHLLLEHDADVNAPPAKTDGRTALEGAAEHGRVDMVQLLLNAGANIFGDGQAQYENAIRRASENGHHAIRRMLEKRHGEREE
ncbi:hypothetical protein V495_01191 [Pseudogymnoascus sp. VKM F-4514 (FW-929)]|nr:hypothetical protein V495_01191 [Pseudogymnoascus sp. VKM F-4514 (FW-929)]KFY64474.1 hypothetical protein V497_01685 [Pseudogymnoascus sp. VKM F-4516 (FW-969)]